MAKKKLNEIYKQKYKETQKGLESHYAPGNYDATGRSFLKNYTDSLHDEINHHLWNEHETDCEDEPHLTNTVVKLDKAVKTHVTPHPLMVYTGVKRPPTEIGVKGASHIRATMPGFTSTSLSPRTASGFAETMPNALFIDHEGKHTDAHSIVNKYGLHKHMDEWNLKHPKGHLDRLIGAARSMRDHEKISKQENVDYEKLKQTHFGHIEKLKTEIKKPFFMLPSTHKTFVDAAADHTKDGNEFGDLLYNHKHSIPEEYAQTLHSIRYSANVIYHSKPRPLSRLTAAYPALEDERTRKELAEHSIIDRHVLRVHIPAGSHGSYVDHMSANPGEHEFILPRNSRFHIDPTPRINKKLGAYVWRAKLVHDGTKPVG